MKDLDFYMNDPDIVDEPLPLRQVHAIRLQIRDETKDMTPEERAKYAAEEVKEFLDQCGLKIKRPENILVKKSS